MSKQKKFAETPLLYIHQPNVSKPKAPMQFNYITPKEKDKLQAEPKSLKSFTPPLKRNNYSKKDSVGNKAEPVNKKEEFTDKKEEEQSPNKKFNEMTIQEKIEYFLAKPVHIPKMKCEVKTEERTFRGSIQDLRENNVLMQVGRRTNLTEIEISAIKEIRLIGF